MEHKSFSDKSSAYDMSRFTIDPKLRSNERNELIKPFVEKINNSRLAGGYKPYTAKYIAVKMSHIPTDELDHFYKKLSASKSFSALWHWHCAPKNK